MIKKVRDDIFIIENFYSKYKVLYNHVLENEALYEISDGCTIKRYSVMNNARDYDISFIDLCHDYINELETVVEKTNKFSIFNKGNFIVGFSVYDTGSRIGLHSDIYDLHDEENPHICSTVHYLNDNYKGGEIVFTEIQLEIKPIENMLLIFNSNYLHETKEIISGRKVVATRFWKKEKGNKNV